MVFITKVVFIFEKPSSFWDCLHSWYFQIKDFLKFALSGGFSSSTQGVSLTSVSPDLTWSVKLTSYPIFWIGIGIMKQQSASVSANSYQKFNTNTNWAITSNNFRNQRSSNCTAQLKRLFHIFQKVYNSPFPLPAAMADVPSNIHTYHSLDV